jgi:hypothetical protein
VMINTIIDPYLDKFNIDFKIPSTLDLFVHIDVDYILVSLLLQFTHLLIKHILLFTFQQHPNLLWTNFSFFEATQLSLDWIVRWNVLNSGERWSMALLVDPPLAWFDWVEVPCFEEWPFSSSESGYSSLSSE